MKNLITLFLTIFISSVCNSQDLPIRPFEQIEYIGFNTKYHHTLFDSSEVGSYDGYNQFKSASIANLDKDHIYIVSLKVDTLGASGFHIEKHKIDDGSIVWRSKFGYPNSANTEMPRDFYINDDGNIECFSQKFPDPYLDWKDGFGSRQMVFVHRLIDSKSGATISTSSGDIGDDDSFRSHFTHLYRLTLSTFFRRNINDYEFWEYHFFPSKPKHWVRSYVSSDSKKSTTVSDSIQLIAFPTLIPPYKISENEYVLFEYEVGVNKLIMRTIDAKLNVLSIDTTPVLGNKLNYLDIVGYDADKQLFLMSNELEPINDFYNPHDLLWIGRDGSLNKRVQLDKNIDGSFTVFDWNENCAKLIAIYNHVDRDYGTAITSLNLLEIQDTIININKRWVSTDTLRTVSGFKVQDIPNSKDKIILWSELSLALSSGGTIIYQDLNASATSLLRISKDDLLVGTDDTEALIIDKDMISIYPNPVTNALNIKTDGIIGNVIISDINGKIIFRHFVENVRELSVDVSKLLQGIIYLV